jgi:hypothetical protein
MPGRSFAARIRDIFLQTSPGVSIDTVYELIGGHRWFIDQDIAEKQIQIHGRGPTQTIMRRDLMQMALDRWPLETIERALGKQASRVLPPLFRLRSIVLRVPFSQIVFLRYLAACWHQSVSSVAAEAFAAFMKQYADSTENDLPDFAEAMHWPNVTNPHNPCHRKPLPPNALKPKSRRG